jgi:YesN/AraC family two-component response regulator
MLVDVLLVEDEKWVRTAIRKVMERSELPLRVLHEASDGMVAAEWLKSHATDLVLTDIRMPVMDGIGLLQEIKHRRYRCDVVVVSGYDDFTYARQALRYGAVDYLLKPVETEHITACISAWMESKDHHQESGIPDFAKNQDAKSKEQSAVQQVIRYVEDHQVYHLTSGEAAELVHLNPSYFSKLFRTTMSMTFTDYMVKLRMNEARRMLEYTSLRVNEIAERLGFMDTAYFSNTFKKVCGLTPREYRRKVRG